MAKPQTKTETISIALIGGETLLGREIEDVLKERRNEVIVHAYSATGEGNFGAEEGEAVYIEPLTAEAINSSRALVVAGSREGALKAYEVAKLAGGQRILVDCTGFLENRPEIRICSPLSQPCDLRPGGVYEIAHPAAAGLDLVLARLAAYQSIRQVVVNVFEPASERGKRGITELQKQTADLLSFKPLDKAVFDAQVSFNMLSQFGEDAPQKLATVEQRVTRHLATLLSRRTPKNAIPSPSLRVIQAPVFHGYSISLWVEFENTVNVAEAGEALASAQIEVRGAQDDAPDNVGAAGQSGLIAGDIRVDENNPRAAWFWIVADNLRLTADAISDLLSTLSTRRL